MAQLLDRETLRKIQLLELLCLDEVVRICEYHKPKVIFCENVKGLISHDHGKTFNIIKNLLKR